MSDRYGCAECGIRYSTLDALAEHDHATHGAPVQYVVGEGLVRVREASQMLVDAYADNTEEGSRRMGRAYLLLVAALADAR